MRKKGDYENEKSYYGDVRVDAGIRRSAECVRPGTEINHRCSGSHNHTTVDPGSGTVIGREDGSIFRPAGCEESDDTVKVEVYADGILFGGDQNSAINMLQDGGLDALVLSTSVYASFIPQMNAVSLPYLFANYDQFTSYLDGAPGQELLASLDKLNIKGLALSLRTYRSITNSKRPITEPADLKGIKIRVPNNRLWVDFFGGLGADPTPMNFGEVYTALQLKTIDAQENPVEVPLANKSTKYRTTSH